MVTVATIRKEVLTRGGWYESITATSGTTTTLADTEHLKDTGESIFAYEDKWVKCLTASAGSALNIGKIRRVDSYSPTSGTLTFGAPFPAAVVLGDTFELVDISPNLVDSCIFTALRRCIAIREDVITYAAGDTALSLASLPWVVAPEYILGLRYRSGSINNQYHYDDIPPYYWKVTRNAASFSIELDDTLRTPSANVALLIRTVAPFVTDTDSFSSITDATTYTVPLDWIVPLATVELINRIGRNADLLSRGTFRLDLATEVQAAEQAASIFAPRLNYEVRING